MASDETKPRILSVDELYDNADVDQDVHDSHEALRSEVIRLTARVLELESALDVRKRCIEGGYQ